MIHPWDILPEFFSFCFLLSLKFLLIWTISCTIEGVWASQWHSRILSGKILASSFAAIPEWPRIQIKENFLFSPQLWINFSPFSLWEIVTLSLDWLPLMVLFLWANDKVCLVILFSLRYLWIHMHNATVFEWKYSEKNSEMKFLCEITFNWNVTISWKFSTKKWIILLQTIKLYSKFYSRYTSQLILT